MSFLLIQAHQLATMDCQHNDQTWQPSHVIVVPAESKQKHVQSIPVGPSMPLNNGVQHHFLLQRGSSLTFKGFCWLLTQGLPKQASFDDPLCFCLDAHNRWTLLNLVHGCANTFLTHFKIIQRACLEPLLPPGSSHHLFSCVITERYTSISLRCQQMLVKMDSFAPQFVLLFFSLDNAIINNSKQLSCSLISCSIKLIWGDILNQFTMANLKQPSIDCWH